MSSENQSPDPPSAAVPKARPGKRGGKRDTNRRERVAALCDAAAPLFLERGIEGTRIDDITTAAGVAKGSFYRYFDGKDALVAHLFGPVQQEVEAAFAHCDDGLQGARTRDEMMAVYRDLGAELTGTLLRHSDLVLLYLQESRAPAVGGRAAVRALADAISQGAVELTHAAHTHGLLRPFPATLSALTVVGASERLLFSILTEGDAFFEGAGVDALEVPEAIASLVLDGLLAKDAG